MPYLQEISEEGRVDCPLWDFPLLESSPSTPHTGPDAAPVGSPCNILGPKLVSTPKPYSEVKGQVLACFNSDKGQT